MKKFIKATAALLAVCSLAGAFAACGSSGGRAYTYDYTWSDEHITYTFYGSSNAFNKVEGDSVLAEIEKKFNVTINLNYSQEWEDRITTMVNSNRNVPDVFFSIPDGLSYPLFVEKGYIVPFNGYLDKLEEEQKGSGEGGTSNLKALFETEYLSRADINGNYYFMPQMTGISNHVLIVRKDWMKQWAQEKKGNADFVPTTISDFTAMLTYFHTENLGNKSDGTYGLGLNENFDFTEDFLSAFGISPSYTKKEDGSYVLSAMTEEYQDYIDWLYQGSQQGYIFPKFGGISESTTKDNFESEKIGAYITICNYTLTNEVRTMKYNLDTEEDIVDFIPFPSSDDGQHVGSPVGDQYYWGGYCISVNAKEPYRLVAILDYLTGKEGQDLFTWGVKGTHYTEDENGIKTLTAENLANRTANMFVTPDNYDKSNVYGEYILGTALSPLKYIIREGKIIYDTPYDLMYEGESYQKRYDEYVTGLEEAGNVNWRLPTFLIDDYDISRDSSSCLDYAQTYTIQAAAASTQAEIDNLRAEMEKQCRARGIDEVLAYLAEQDK